MRKRYIVPPVGLVITGAIWYTANAAATPVANAEGIHQYTQPTAGDPRHPVDVYYAGINAGADEATILRNLPTVIYPEDKVAFTVDPAYGLGTIVHVTRAMPITINDGSTNLSVRTWDDTVGQLLNDTNRQLGDLDKANVTNNTQLVPKLVIVINRVAKTNVTVTQSVPFDVVKRNDATMWEGDSKVTQAGANGVRTIVYQVTRQDGIEVSRSVVSSAVTTVPTDEVIHVGTKPRITTACGGYDSLVLSAAVANGVDPNALCYRLVAESNGNPRAKDAYGHEGLFQYTSTFWATMARMSGNADASIWDASSQIEVTAWAWGNGYRAHWPNP